MKKVAFVTGTRADYSKLAPLIRRLKNSNMFDVGVFITGMHMLAKYGSTHREIERFSSWDYRFINQEDGERPTNVYAKTIQGFSDFVAEEEPDLVIAHGDRLEALAATVTCAMTNTFVAHIEGGEVSGTIDDSYRHAITKLAHAHFVSNEESGIRVRQLGESQERIFVIGSPELDLMSSRDLPKLQDVLARYEIPWVDYRILIFHPVATEPHRSFEQAANLVSALKRIGGNYVVVESNNDLGSHGIREAFVALKEDPRFKVLPSMRYEFFLVLLRHCEFIIGNSSTGVREAPHYGVPSVNIGSRQFRRTNSPLVKNCGDGFEEIESAIDSALTSPRIADQRFGNGKSAQLFAEVLAGDDFWSLPLQKVFEDFRALSVDT